ncbi:MAG: D-hexose-6-phosphate mutarotase [Gammaproteobacteria bacterium]|nr:D-hexose-6-phosphate mutarotase [Gammaproteobacteria bacterium]
MTLDDLNSKFALDSMLNFVEGEGGMPVVEVVNQHCAARISLQGAQVTSWIPTGEREVIWLSADASFKQGKSIRGGIPVCWPWFGAHESEADFPAHGYARTVFWDVLETAAMDDGATLIRFKIMENELTRKFWPYSSELIMTLKLGSSLDIELLTHNTDSKPFKITQALHTYFNISDVRNVTVTGLDGCDYLDKLDQFAKKQQAGAVDLVGETDRIYLNTQDDYSIVDPGFKRTIQITKSGSHSAVVWNPWQATAEKMGDLGKDGYLQMLCVETANAADDFVLIEPGQSHRLFAKYLLKAS